MARNVFAEYVDQIYDHRFAGELQIAQVMGGTPSNSKVAEAWLRTKMGLSKEDEIARAVEAVMEARAASAEGPISADDALKEVDRTRNLNGFKRDENGLYMEGRHLKASIKEGASVARAAGNLDARYGTTNKGTIGFVAEHIFVVEDRLYLYREDSAGKIVHVTEPTDTRQSFPKNPITNQTGIQYTEYVDDAIVAFTVESDWGFKESEWAAIWVTAGNIGVGASRSQGFGRYIVTKWDRLPVKK